MRQLICIEMNVAQSDEEIKDCIRRILPLCHKNKMGACFSIQGFDDDEREVWEIPETIEFMKKLVDLGFMSILEISTTSPSLVRTEIFHTDKLPGLGAIELWMCATSRMGNGANEVTPAEFKMFTDALQASNAKAESLLNNTTPKSFEKPIKPRYNKA